MDVSLIRDIIIVCLPLLVGWILDLCIGDPEKLPHLIVYFGKAIGFCEHRFNKGTRKSRKIKGGLSAIGLILLVFFLSQWLLNLITNIYLNILVQAILIFYCLSGTTLIKEVRDVFLALDKGLEQGRKQVARIVGRDTMTLSAHEVRTADLKTLAENLSDGVVAPLFWYALLGVPGMLAYKMVNTLDSMIGYRNDRYKDFGCVAARIDDVANYIPARITSLLMLLCCQKGNLIGFVRQFGRQHLSPNSGYPEAALAGILNCRFGGPHDYFGQEVYKPYIGENHRELTTEDMGIATSINRRVEYISIGLALCVRVGLFLLLG